MRREERNIDLFTLQKLLTHKSPQMVQRYAHLRDEALRRASNLAGELVNEAAKQVKWKDIKETKVVSLMNMGNLQEKA